MLLTMLSRAPLQFARGPRQFFGPMNQPKWTQVDVKKVRKASTQSKKWRSQCACRCRVLHLIVWYLLHDSSTSMVLMVYRSRDGEEVGVFSPRI